MHAIAQFYVVDVRVENNGGVSSESLHFFGSQLHVCLSNNRLLHTYHRLKMHMSGRLSLKFAALDGCCAPMFDYG
jgi:hypothetical protein